MHFQILSRGSKPIYHNETINYAIKSTNQWTFSFQLHHHQQSILILFLFSFTVSMLGFSRNHLVLVHELDLRQHCSVSSWIGATWNCISCAILDVDDHHWCASCSTRDGFGSISGSRISAWLESIAVLQRRIRCWTHRIVAWNDLDIDADVTRSSLHRTNVLQFRAIQTVSIGSSAKRRRTKIRRSANDWAIVPRENFSQTRLGLFAELWTAGNWIGVPLGHHHDVVSC